MRAYFRALARYFDGSGRSTRGDFWGFSICMALVLAVAIFLDRRLVHSSEDPPLGPVTAVAAALHVIPSLALLVRRLHDIGRSAMWVPTTLLLSAINVVLLSYLSLVVLTSLALVMLTFLAFARSTIEGDEDGAVDERADLAAPAPRSVLTPLARVEGLASLRAAGAISEDEFSQMKADLLRQQIGSRLG